MIAPKLYQRNMILVSNYQVDDIFIPHNPSAAEIQSYHNIVKYYPSHLLKELMETPKIGATVKAELHVFNKYNESHSEAFTCIQQLIRIPRSRDMTPIKKNYCFYESSGQRWKKTRVYDLVYLVREKFFANQIFVDRVVDLLINIKTQTSQKLKYLIIRQLCLYLLLCVDSPLQ